MSLSVLSTKAANLYHKSEDLKNKVRYFECGIFAIQETHFRKKGRFKMQDFQVFESIRKKQGARWNYAWSACGS